MQLLQTVTQVLDWYVSNELRQFSPVAHTERMRIWDLFGSYCGREEVTSCKPAQLLTFIASQRGCSSNHTRKRIRATVCRPFNAAVTYGLIARNPFAGVKIPSGKAGRDWTNQEYQAALRSCSPHFRRLIVFLRFSGCRPGEARTLRWSEVRKEVQCCVQEAHKTAHINGERRRIYWNHVTLKLIEWLHRHKAHATYVFANAFGRQWTIGALVRHMDSIRERASLPGDTKFHGLRHTFATTAIINGVDIRTLADLLGHATTRTTERYVHLCDKRQWLNDAANEAIGRKNPKPLG